MRTTVTSRDHYAATMHVFIAGGFLLSLFSFLVFLGAGLPAGGFVGVFLLFSLAMMAVGGFLVIKRRLKRPKRLSGGGFARLPYSLFAFLAGLLLLLASEAKAGSSILDNWLTLIACILLLWGLVELVIGMTWGGPMKHAFAGALHLAYHPRPQRFTKKNSATDLNLLDLKQETLGVEKIQDFNWNQLLGFDACVQCGRCEVACPAFASEQPLNPKKLIQDLVAGSPLPAINKPTKAVLIPDKK